MKKLLLPILSFVLLLTACYDKDIQEINNRLDMIENQKIATLSEQIEAINKTIPLLSEVDEQLSEHISSLEDKSSEEFAALKDANSSLKNQIAELEKYIDNQLSKTTDWVNGTFATLEQHNTVVAQIEKIKTQVDNLKPELLDAISKSEEALKTWVSEQLTDYYKIAEIDAKIEAIENSIKSGDETITASLNELKESLQATKTALTEAYTKAIEDAITNNNGVINSKIAAEIAAVNKRIDNEVDTINTKIAALEERIEAIEDKLDEILGRKLDITFDVDSNIIVAPNYTLEIGYSVTSSTNSATVEVTSSADIKAKVVTNGLNGKISVTTGSTIDEYSKVVVFVSNGENVIMRSITFEEATVQINNSDTKIIPVEGGKVELSFLTNVECEVVIPSSASSWLTVAPTTMALEQRTITLQATANEGTNRSAVVIVKSLEGNLAVEYTINQMSNITILNYTTNDGKPLDPYTIEGFDAELAENSYDAATGNGFLKFNGKIDTIPANAFVACTNLTWIEIPDCITTIGDSAFNSCTFLAVMDIPQGVNTIGDKAFYNCSGMTEITIPSSVTTIGKSSFEGCGGKANINCKIPDIYSYPMYPSESGQFYKAKFTEVIFGDSVTKVGFNAFRCCNSIINITIPENVIEIGKYTFSDCSSVKSVTISDSVTKIGSGAFLGCTSLKEVYYTGDLSAWYKIDLNDGSANPAYNGAKLYLNGMELTEATIPSDITEIKCTFTGCASLKSVILHSRITSIGAYAFYGCSSLTSVNITDSVTTIGYDAFNGCKSLTSVIIGNSVTSIGEWAFSSCTSLTSVTIPDSVTSIGRDAFEYCTSLKEVYCKPTTPPSGGSWMFDNNAFGRKIYVPRASADAYKAASGWSSYYSNIEPYDFE